MAKSEILSRNPAISIIIPVYNQEKYVGKCIRSVLSQSFQDFEVIIVNDGSTDKSLAICQKYADRDSRISIVDKQNEGRAPARKDGFLRSKGEYICFLDSDDYLLPNALETLYSVARDKDVDMIIGSFQRVMDSWGLVKRPPILYPKELTDRVIAQSELRPLMLGLGGRKNYLFGVLLWGKLYRRDCIERANKACGDSLFPISREVTSEDDMFNLTITPFLESAWVTNIIVCHYRYGGFTSQDYPVIRKCGFIYDLRYDDCFKYGCESVIPEIFERYIIHLQWDVVNQIRFRVSSEQEIKKFISNEWNNRKIVPWARQHQSELSDEMKKDSLAQFILNDDIYSYYAAIFKLAEMKQQKLKKKLLDFYQRMADWIGLMAE